MKVPVLVGVDRSGLVGEDGETHHGAFDLPMLLPVPNLTVVSPATAEELRWAVERYLTNLKGPVFLRYPKEAAEEGILLPSVGEVSLLKEGRGTVVLSTSTLSVKLLKTLGEAALIHIPVLKPLPEEKLTELLKRGDYDRVVIADESPALLGFGKYIFPVVNSALPAAKVEIKGLPDYFVSHGKREELLEELSLLKI
jgi:1-deoxy-D-xylulose-5-phosphate synthase